MTRRSSSTSPSLTTTSYELKYNTANLAAIGEKVPGALALPGDVWYTSKQIGTLPVWWDIAE